MIIINKEQKKEEQKSKKIALCIQVLLSLTLMYSALSAMKVNDGFDIRQILGVVFYVVLWITFFVRIKAFSIIASLGFAIGSINIIAFTHDAFYWEFGSYNGLLGGHISIGLQPFALVALVVVMIIYWWKYIKRVFTHGSDELSDLWN